jgi:CheY-like chemotaxis protein/anti-sigma regulatory factor (Ser/Thr protein kinase)
VMSHEMRTPLSGLLSATDLIETTTTLDDQQSWLVGIVRSCGQAALEQVNNILELTRLAARDTNDYPHSDFNLSEVVKQQVQLYNALAHEGRNTLLITVDDACNGQIRAPLPLLRRILNNLLSNAIKFTRDGTIEVSLAAEVNHSEGPCRFTMSIRDTGIGIAEADLGRIFHNFETLDSSYSRTQEGTGLGLGIAKLAAEAMGGEMQVESKLGVGTCFTVTFEAEWVRENGANTAIEEAEVPRYNPLKILLAEDNEINCLLLERQLSRLGHSVTTAGDGALAIAAVEREKFDVILMDISMPNVDGLTATAYLRENGHLAATPVIALTAQAAPNRVQMLRDAGMADVVTKPAPIALLEDTMQRLVAKKPHIKPAHATVDTPLIDVAQLGDLMADLGTEVLQDMAGRFGHEMNATRLALSAALQEGNLVRLSQVAHKSAGAAAVLTMLALAAELRAMESAAVDGAVEGLSERCEKLGPLSDESLQALQQRLVAA